MSASKAGDSGARLPEGGGRDGGGAEIRGGAPRFKVAEGGVEIPVPGGKTIQEIFGRVSTGEGRFSLARMVAPSGWTEPPQTPEFGELTVMLRGRLRIDVDGEPVELAAGQSIWVEPGTRVHYRNESGEECEYLAICLPAFTPEAAHREE